MAAQQYGFVKHSKCNERQRLAKGNHMHVKLNIRNLGVAIELQESETERDRFGNLTPQYDSELGNLTDHTVSATKNQGKRYINFKLLLALHYFSSHPKSGQRNLLQSDLYNNGLHAFYASGKEFSGHT